MVTHPINYSWPTCIYRETTSERRHLRSLVDPLFIYKMYIFYRIGVGEGKAWGKTRTRKRLSARPWSVLSRKAGVTLTTLLQR